MKKMRNIEFAKEIIKNNIDIFRCPICKGQMLIKENSLLCAKKHCFDLSRNGYINLLTNNIQSKYDRQLFVSRRLILQTGLFQKMIEKISKIILETNKNKEIANLRILDAGCGEGSNLVEISKNIDNQLKNNCTGIGIDISKEGIRIASSTYTGFIWSIADIAAIPCNDNKCDCIVNILSPANYSEFARILEKDGLLIKVIPGNRYLQEIRRELYGAKDKRQYSNDDIISLFRKNFSLLREDKLVYKQNIEKSKLIQLLKMTPLSWNIKEQDWETIEYSKISSITVDFTILTGKITV